MSNFDLKKYLAEGRLLKEVEAKSYKYAFLYNGETLSVYTQEEFDNYVSDIAQDYDGDKAKAIEWMNEGDRNVLRELPNKPYLFIFANDEDLSFITANNKEEFVEVVNNDFHGMLEGDTDEMWNEICRLADESYIDGDSYPVQIVIENGKIVGGNSSNSAQDVDTSSYTIVTTKSIK